MNLHSSVRARATGQDRGARVLHVAGLLSVEGAYGGPLVVAADQCAALAVAGAKVALAVGWDGRAEIHAEGVRIHRFRAWRLTRRSFASLVSPALVWGVVRRLRSHDIVHVHLARDLVTLPAAWISLLSGRCLFVQPHGMVRSTDRPVVRVLDLLFVRPLLRRAHGLFALTLEELDDLVLLGARRDRVTLIFNGVPVPDRGAIYAGTGPLVLYASRLAERKRPTAFVHAAAIVRRSRPDVHFEIRGPDEGQLAEVLREIEACGLESSCLYSGPRTPDEARKGMADAQVFVLPSFAEPFPVAVLEAMAAGVPVVVTHDTGLSHAVDECEAGVVTDGSPEAMAKAILHTLAEAETWHRVGSNARSLVSSHFSPDQVAMLLLDSYGRSFRGRSAS